MHVPYPLLRYISPEAQSSGWQYTHACWMELIKSSSSPFVPETYLEAPFAVFHAESRGKTFIYRAPLSLIPQESRGIVACYSQYTPYQITLLYIPKSFRRCITCELVMIFLTGNGKIILKNRMQ